MTRPLDRTGCPTPLIYYLQSTVLAHSQAIAHHLTRPDRDSRLTSDAIAQASGVRIDKMLKGIDRWQAHPFCRPAVARPVIWESNGAKLHDCGNPDDPPVLIIPSLINRHYVLDLLPNRSFVEHLRRTGLRPLLLEWSQPPARACHQGMQNHIEHQLLPAFDAIEAMSQRPVSLVGYCMGGTIALGLATHLGARVHKLGLIGAPWDFANLKGTPAIMRRNMVQHGLETCRMHIHNIAEVFGAIPADLFQHLFAVLSPMQMVQKFTKFADLPKDSTEAQLFVAVEDWLADRVAVDGGVAETLLVDWYGTNQTAQGQWQLFGKPVDPSEIPCPTLIITGKKDHIVPPELSTPLLQQLPNARSISVDMGHVGMIVGTQAYASVATPLSTFLLR